MFFIIFQVDQDNDKLSGELLNLSNKTIYRGGGKKNTKKIVAKLII